MSILNPDSLLSRFKYDLAILFLLTCLGVGAWLTYHPFSFESTDEEAVGERPPSVGSGEVLLVVPEEAQTGGEFDELDFTYAWYNSLVQELGAFQIQSTKRFGSEDLSTIRMVVVPSRSAEELDATDINQLQVFVESGGILILEMPSQKWARLTGIDEPVLMGRSAKRITAAVGSMLQGDFGQHLIDCPMNSRMMRLDTVDIPDFHRSDILLEIDGVPAHYHRAAGQGHVFVVAFDFGMALTALQQGLPGDALLLDPLDGEEDEDPLFTRPERAVANPKMRTAAVPYADLLERHIFYAPLKARPSVRLWSFPNTLAGALVMTHEEGGFGDKATYMAEFESKNRFTSTYFVSPTNMTNNALDELQTHGIDVALGWHRTLDPIYEARGVGRLKPYQSALSLVEQRERLEGWAGRRLHTTRSRGLIWDRHYSQTFRKLAAASIYVDSSYGPGDVEEYGYLFGTGLPFYPLDDNGLLLPILEIPFVLSDDVGFGPDDLDVVDKLLKESRSGFHQLITVDIDADAMARHPQPATLDTWIRCLEMAEQERHWLTNLHEFVLFTEARRQASVHTDFDAPTRTLTGNLELPSQRSPRDDSVMPSPGLAFPARFEGGNIESVILDGQPVEPKTLGHSGDGVLAVLAVSAGTHRVKVVYGASPQAR